MKGSFNMGFLLASFSEFIVNNDIDNKIIEYLYGWIWNSKKITNTIGSDTESCAITIFSNLTAKYSPTKKNSIFIKYS